ncbi:hypothetical protein DFJ73DRAFT_522536 [Zopfochytrium polystomum]|nr:hypothetical protein DFJ73DRAFT_522536 [Zopfochytrium polystomum]
MSWAPPPSVPSSPLPPPPPPMPPPTHTNHHHPHPPPQQHPQQHHQQRYSQHHYQHYNHHQQQQQLQIPHQKQQQHQLRTLAQEVLSPLAPSTPPMSDFGGTATPPAQGPVPPTRSVVRPLSSAMPPLPSSSTWMPPPGASPALQSHHRSHSHQHRSTLHQHHQPDQTLSQAHQQSHSLPLPQQLQQLYLQHHGDEQQQAQHQSGEMMATGLERHGSSADRYPHFQSARYRFERAPATSKSSSSVLPAKVSGAPLPVAPKRVSSAVYDSSTRPIESLRERRTASPTSTASPLPTPSVTSKASQGSSLSETVPRSPQSRASSLHNSVTGSNWTARGSRNTLSTLHPPVRPTHESVENLLDLGCALFAPPNSNHKAAFDKWELARAQAEKDYNLFGLARALSNMGCAYRSLSQFQSGLSCLKRSWAASMAFCQTEQLWQSQISEKGSSLWFNLVSEVLDLDNPDVYIVDVIDSIDSDAFTSLNQSQLADLFARRTQAAGVPDDPFCGPPVVVWFMNLTTNLGNSYLSLGKFEHAIHWHTKCLLLAEAVLERYPLPIEFVQSAHSTLSRKGTLTGAKPATEKVKLSFLHQSAILAQTRSLTHIGVCLRFLGLDDDELQSHSNASSILAFFADRSPSFSPLAANESNRKGKSRETEESATTSLQWWRNTQFDCYMAAVSANLASAYHAKGRLPAAIERLQRAAKHCKSAKDELNSSRIRSALGALKIEIGRVLGSLHWIRNMELQAVGAGEVNECMRYWGPPRIKGFNLNSGEWDESASISAGSQWVRQGIQLILNELHGMANSADTLGVMTSLLNIASGYIIEKHPYMALHTIGQLIQDGHSPWSINSETAQAQGEHRIPSFLQLHTCYTVCQAAFLLTRLQREPDQPLYPGPIPDEIDELPFFNPIPINAVLNELGVGFVSIDLPDLDSLIAGYFSTHDTVLQARAAVQSSPTYSVLHFYLSDGVGAGTAGIGSSWILASKELPTSVISAADTATMGVGLGMELLQQKFALISAMGGKADWLIAARYDTLFRERQSRDHYVQGTLKLDRAAKEIVKALVPATASGWSNSGSGTAGSSGLSGTLGRASTDSAATSAEAGLVSAFFSLTGAAFAVPPLNPTAPPIYHHSPPVFSPVVTPALRATLFACPALFGLAADTMAFAAYHLQARATAVSAATGYDDPSDAVTAAGVAASGLDLLRILRIPLHPGPAKVHRELLSAAASMYSALLGLCESCMREYLYEPDAGVDIVFVGRSSGGDADSNEKDAGVQHKFPCDHFFWRGGSNHPTVRFPFFFFSPPISFGSLGCVSHFLSLCDFYSQ